MNGKYGLHPKEFALGETEKYYSDMAGKGWELADRGIIFSKFRKTAPQQMRYRVEVVAPNQLHEGTLPEEQIAIYDECGWEYVTGSGYIHVFRAPVGSAAPEFYLEPEQQAATLKCLRKNQLIALISPLLYLLVMLIMHTAFSGYSPREISSGFYWMWVTDTEFVTLISLTFILVICNQFWEVYQLNRLYRNLKKGTPLNHAPKSRRLISISVELAVLVLFCTALGYHFFADNSYPMPASSADPYIFLADLGMDGKRTTSFVTGKESTVTYKQTHLAEYWKCSEYVSYHGNEEWLKQDTYILKNKNMVPHFTIAVMNGSAFAPSEDGFKPVTIDGLDQAWISNYLQCVAVKGNMVTIFTHPWENEKDMIAALKAVSEKWNSVE